MKILGNAEHKILFGDVLEALNNIKDESVDLIFADPPYNIGKSYEKRTSISEYIKNFFFLNE